MRRTPLTKDRIDAVIDALTKAAAGQDNDHDYKGALDWATAYKATFYHTKEAQP